LPPLHKHNRDISASHAHSHAPPLFHCQQHPLDPLSPPIDRPVAMDTAAFLSLSPELRDALVKVAVFVFVQGLVYLILRSSSDVFSKDGRLRSLSFRPMRSMSVRRVLAPLSDVPVGTDEPSTSPSLSSAASRRRASRED
uniref:Uncharacterized protein n=3 Tax=Setaria TaxID=4554 RepID=K3Z0P5_SETIT